MPEKSKRLPVGTRIRLRPGDSVRMKWRERGLRHLVPFEPSDPQYFYYKKRRCERAVFRCPRKDITWEVGAVYRDGHWYKVGPEKNANGEYSIQKGLCILAEKEGVPIPE